MAVLSLFTRMYRLRIPRPYLRIVFNPPFNPVEKFPDSLLDFLNRPVMPDNALFAALPRFLNALTA